MKRHAPFRALSHFVQTHPETTAWMLPFLLVAVALIPFGGLR